MIILKKSLLALMLGTCCLDAQAADSDRQWWHLLNASDPVLQTEWGGKYEHGEGVSQDYGRAVRLYCAAARQGYALAQYQLGWLYANGRGGFRDDALAAAWFRLAALQGHIQAKNMLTLLDDGNQTKKPLCVIPAESDLSVQLTAKPSLQRREVEDWVHRLAPHYGLDPELVLAVIEVESAFNYQARSPKNAQGLMQLIPETADRFGVQDTMDPLQNLHGGMAYLRWLLAFFQGDVRLALAGYNAGERAVERYQGIPPYRETQAYVARITQIYGQAIHPPVARVVKPSAILAVVNNTVR